jgi:hypothetical protein
MRKQMTKKKKKKYIYKQAESEPAWRGFDVLEECALLW